ncbi:MAG: orotate phosphoribosyltransferase [Methanospirillum sp.]|nr:orotate phosphoribosyltransferase [Methanospirillum sp.]
MVTGNPIADRLIAAGAITFGTFTLASGATSPYYVDIKTASTDPDLLADLARAVVKTAGFEVVAGVAVGGVPLAVAVSLVTGRPFAIVRSGAKDHGRADLVIGQVSGREVLLVEDVTTSGGSALYGVEELRRAGAHVEHVVTIVDREGGAGERLAAAGVRLDALVRARELLAG